MALHWIWWIAAALAVGAELLTGTFYLLAIGVAVAAGGVAAWLGWPLEMQFLVAGALGVTLTIVAHNWRVQRVMPAPQPGLDIGHEVQVRQWHPDGSARVFYRGTLWDAELVAPDVVREGPLFIVATRGSILVLGNRRPAQ